jgi:hypothetical protein
MWNLRGALGGRSGGSDACDGQALRYVSWSFATSLLMLRSELSSRCAGLSAPVETSVEVLGDRGLQEALCESAVLATFVTNRAFDFVRAAAQLAFRWATAAMLLTVFRS